MKKITKSITIIISIFIMMCMLCALGIKIGRTIKGYNTNKIDRKMNKYQQWVADMEQLEEVLDSVTGINVRYSGKERKESFSKLKKDIIDKKLDDVDIYFRVREILSDIKINHIGLTEPEEISKRINKYYFPVAGKWFGEEYYIISSDKDNESIIGGKLVSINGLSFEDICKRYDSIIINETYMDFKNQFFQSNGIKGFNFEVLRYLNIVEDDEAIFVVNKNGQEMKFKFKAVKAKDVDTGVIKMVDISTQMTSLPLGEQIYFKESKGKPFYYYYDVENKVMYFQYIECYDKTDENEKGLEYTKDYPILSAYVDEMINYMKVHEDTCSQFVFDLRNNKGGKQYLIENAFDKHVEYLRNKNIKILVGNNKSAGHMAVDYLLEEFPAAKLYGEESSSFIYFFTNVPAKPNVKLKNCKWKITIPSEMWYGKNICSRQEDWDEGINPDFEVHQSYEDYINGVDTVYTYAITH